jgi:hypothetical protein
MAGVTFEVVVWVVGFSVLEPGQTFSQVGRVGGMSAGGEGVWVGDGDGEDLCAVGVG